MKIGDIAEIIEGTIICGIDKSDYTAEYAFASDLMSDVLRINKKNMILITGLSNIQAIRTAEVSDISFIVFARNKKVSKDMIRLANENNMVLIESSLSMFKISGELYRAGIKPLF